LGITPDEASALNVIGATVGLDATDFFSIREGLEARIATFEEQGRPLEGVESLAFRTTGFDIDEYQALEGLGRFEYLIDVAAANQQNPQAPFAFGEIFGGDDAARVLALGRLRAEGGATIEELSGYVAPISDDETLSALESTFEAQYLGQVATAVLDRDDTAANIFRGFTSAPVVGGLFESVFRAGVRALPDLGGLFGLEAPALRPSEVERPNIQVNVNAGLVTEEERVYSEVEQRILELIERGEVPLHSAGSTGG